MSTADDEHVAPVGHAVHAAAGAAAAAQPSVLDEDGFPAAPEQAMLHVKPEVPAAQAVIADDEHVAPVGHAVHVSAIALPTGAKPGPDEPALAGKTDPAEPLQIFPQPAPA